MFKLGLRSRYNLRGVHPDLRRIVELAIQISPVDFTVIEGVRGKSRQQALLLAGASRTLRSRHLTGHAVDIVAFVGGKVSVGWDTAPIIADAMKDAAKQLRIPLEWGACWDKPMNRMTLDAASEMELYADRWRKLNPNSKRGPLLDGPHFQLPRKQYPA